MNSLLRPVAFWSFQIINTLTGVGMSLNPRGFHEGLLRDPQRVYQQLGFSDVAVEMLHNVIRGQGVALLAISIFLWIVGPRERSSYLLISLTCALSVVAHLMTLRHHLSSPLVMEAIGGAESLYLAISITSIVGVLASGAYFTWRCATTTDRQCGR
jgi:hypothetical protein